MKNTITTRCFSLKWLLTALLSIFFLTNVTMAQINRPGVAPVQIPAGGFAVDGDAVANFPTPGPYSNAGDWFSDPAYPGAGGTIFDMSTSDPFDLIPALESPIKMAKHYNDEWQGTDPTRFLTSNKINDNPNTYQWGPGPTDTPGKNEINNATVAFTYGDPALGGNPNHLWAIIAGDRHANNGSSYIDFEFLQNSLTMTGTTSGGFVSTGPHNGRTVGDLLITLEFINGGVIAEVVINKWTAVGAGYQYVTQDIDDYAGQVYSTANLVTTVAPWQPFGQSEYLVNQYAEAAINLSTIFNFSPDDCANISTVFVRTRTSGNSSSSELTDFPGEPFQVNISNSNLTVNCPGAVSLPSCTSASAIQTAYDAWKAGFSVTGTHTPQSNIAQIPALPANAACAGANLSFTLIATDACGNEESCSSTFVVAPDLTAPVIVDKPDFKLEGCNTDWPLEVTTTWNDNCGGGGTISGVAGPVQDGDCEQYRDYTFNVSDACGNAAVTTTTRVTRIYDVTNPIIEEVADYTLEGCNTDWPAVVSTSWSDNCSEGGTVEGVPGEVHNEGCYQTREYVFTVEDDCGNDATSSVVITRKYDVTAPVITTLADYILPGCNPDWPETVTTSWTDNCSEGGSINGVPGEVMTEGCTQTIEYTFNVMDDCGNPAATKVTKVSRTFDTSNPVITEVDDYTLEGCNTPWPEVVSTTWTDECSGTGSVNAVPGEVHNEGCYQTREYVFTVEDDCGNDATSSVVITRKYDVTAPVITTLADYTLPGCNPDWPETVSTSWTDNCSEGGSIDGVPGEVMTEGCTQTIEYTFNVMDDCGNPAATKVTKVTRTYDEIAPVISTEITDLNFTCSEDVVIPTVTFSDACGIVETICEIEGWSGECADYEFLPGTETEVCFSAVDDCGNTSEVTCITITVDPCASDFCTLTKGFYGNAGGTYCDGRSTTQLLNDLLITPLELGSGARTFTIPIGASSCVISILPGGGPSNALPEGAWGCNNLGNLIDAKKGELTNNLLAQTITLGLNMRLDGDLASLQFISPNFYTMESSGCGEDDATPIGDPTYYTGSAGMPLTVMNILGGTPTVAQIYQLANDALAGASVGVPLGDITAALDRINKSLDECAFIFFLPVTQSAPITSDIKKSTMNLMVSPNPFTNEATITYQVEMDSKVTLEVYNMQGAKVAVLYEGQAQAGNSYTHKYVSSDNAEQFLVIVLRSNYGIISERVIRMK